TGFGAHSLPCPALQTGLSVSPTSNFDSSGDVGGPFTPDNKIYTLENLGPGGITYTVSTDAPWITITNGNGYLPTVGSTAQVTVSINALADSFPNGLYTDTVQFTNVTDHVGDTIRNVNLLVGDPDFCENAEVICPGTYSGSTAGLTNDGSASCGSSNSSPDRWFKYTPLTNGTLELDTCDANFDTVLSVHTGCPGTSANQVACGDDTGWLGYCGFFPTDQSYVSLSVTAGTTYYIRVSGNSQTGNYVLAVSGPACEPPPTGACCFGDGSCSVDSAGECIAAGGTYQGDGTGCSPNPCEAACATPGDIDSDGYITGNDIQCFVECLIQGPAIGCDCPCADIAPPPNGNGELDEDDVAAFVGILLS
ncbi:MAG: hypothetical protein ABII12_01400, partial [Planctomycetota bacterium]